MNITNHLCIGKHANKFYWADRTKYMERLDDIMDILQIQLNSCHHTYSGLLSL
jgi:uncharacterized alpha-E superfamily protein